MNIDLANYLLSLAVKEAKLSNCQKRQYGALVVPTMYLRWANPSSCDEPLVLATGCNQAYEECDPCLRMDVDSGTRNELCKAVHAEQMALVNAVAKLGYASLRDYSMVVSGKNIPQMKEPHFYCSMCARQMSLLNIGYVVVSTASGPACMTMEEALESAMRFACGELKVSELE